MSCWLRLLRACVAISADVPIVKDQPVSARPNLQVGLPCVLKRLSKSTFPLSILLSAEDIKFHPPCACDLNSLGGLSRKMADVRPAGAVYRAPASKQEAQRGRGYSSVVGGLSTQGRAQVSIPRISPTRKSCKQNSILISLYPNGGAYSELHWCAYRATERQ